MIQCTWHLGGRSALCIRASSFRSNFFFFTSSAALRPLHSFPTRRSSDLFPHAPDSHAQRASRRRWIDHSNRRRWPATIRSEEHTSELQSRFDLVCRLLLEKKKESPAQRLQLGQLERGAICAHASFSTEHM